jgi:hypothetical protein
MADRLSRNQLLQLARLGAARRIDELKAEIRAIERTMGPKSGARSAAASGRKRRRPRWSANARKAAADRMKKYWAERKAKRK